MSFTTQSFLSEALAFATLWAASRWARLPQFHVEDFSVTDTSVLGQIQKTTLFRIAAAVSLVLFQILLAGADSSSRWVTPLITIGVFAIVHIANQSDPKSTQGYALLSPSNWPSPKFDVKEPSTIPFISVAAASLLLWTDIKSINGVSSALLLLASGIGFFAFLIHANGGSTDISEKVGTNQGNSTKLVKEIAVFAGGLSFVLLLLVAYATRESVDLVVVFETLMKAAQAFGLVLFASENALAASTTVTLAGIAVAVAEEPTNFPGARPLLAFCGSAVQLALTAPKSNDKRLLLFGLLFLPGLLLPISSNFTFPASGFRNSVSAPDAPTADVVTDRTHPVVKLFNKWTKEHDEKVARQSKTIEDAVSHYRTRYQMEPPPGFDVWFKFAQDNDYILVDEFDTLMTSMKPFWDVRPKDLSARIKLAAEKGENFAEIEVIDSNVTRISWDHWYTESIRQWFDKFQPLEILPDFNFTMNAFDEPRTIFHPEYMSGNKGKNQKEPISLSEADKNDVTWKNVPKMPQYPEIAPSCPNGGYPEVDDESSWTLTSNGISFVDGRSSQQDPCLSRSLRTEHGFFLAPDSMRLTHNVVPIFSQAAPQRYTDILYPTPFYYSAYEGDMAEIVKDHGWESKKDQVYWAGSSTGGHITLENWKHLHRARVSLMTSPDSVEPVTLLERNNLGKWQSYQSWWGAISKYFSINLTRLVQCEDGAREKMEKAFNLTQQPGDAYLGYKYVLDIDGNSYTGRYSRFIRSSGAVIKSTIFREWHDDILTPWVHYIPLSNSAQEFGELMRFLINEPGGDDIGRAIGLGGKTWSEKAFRPQDMEVYALRVFMEYARLFDEERDTHVFHLD